MENVCIILLWSAKQWLPWQFFSFEHCQCLFNSVQHKYLLIIAIYFTQTDTHSWLNTSCISCLQNVWVYLLYQSTELICLPYLQIWIDSTSWRVFSLTSHQPYNVLKLCHWNVKFHANILTIIQGSTCISTRI